MKYVIVVTQTDEKYYCAIVGSKIEIDYEPTHFYQNKNDAILDLYRIKCRDIHNIKKLYHNTWKSKKVVTYKKLKRSWYKDTKYNIEAIEDA